MDQSATGVVSSLTSTSKGDEGAVRLLPRLFRSVCTTFRLCDAVAAAAFAAAAATRFRLLYPPQPCSFLPPLELTKQAARKLPLLCSGDAKGGTISMGGDDGEKNVTGDTIKPNGEDTRITNATLTKDAVEPPPATAAATPDKQASVPEEAASTVVSCTRAEGARKSSAGESVTANDTSGVGRGVDGTKAMDSQKNGDTANAAEMGANSRFGDDKEGKGPGQGDDMYDNGEDDDELSSSVEGGQDSNDWADVEAGERTGYSGAEVGPFAVKEGVDGCCVIEVCYG